MAWHHGPYRNHLCLSAGHWRIAPPLPTIHQQVRQIGWPEALPRHVRTLPFHADYVDPRAGALLKLDAEDGQRRRLVLPSRVRDVDLACDHQSGDVRIRAEGAQETVVSVLIPAIISSRVRDVDVASDHQSCHIRIPAEGAQETIVTVPAVVKGWV